jgi:hypothetical protein
MKAPKPSFRIRASDQLLWLLVADGSQFCQWKTASKSKVLTLLEGSSCLMMYLHGA